MRRTTFAAALLAVTLTACSSSGGGKSSPSATTIAAPRTLAPSTTLEATYLKLMRDYLPNDSDAEMLALGHGICREFDDGLSWTSIVTGFVDGGTEAKTSGAVIALSVVAFCPGHRVDLPDS